MSSQIPDKQPPGQQRRAHTIAIISVACVCGWFIMEVEILGGRALTPYFGSAVYVVMGSVIGVFLLSLSGGYILGGWLSQKPYWERVLGVNLMVAGAWLAGVPFLLAPVCDSIAEITLDERWGSLMAASVLFGAPTVLLATVSPTAVRSLTSRASDSGLNAGLVFALSTAAGFAGCMVTAFYLVLLSLRRTFWISGLILHVLGLAILFHAILWSQRRPSNVALEANGTDELE